MTRENLGERTDRCASMIMLVCAPLAECVSTLYNVSIGKGDLKGM